MLIRMQGPADLWLIDELVSEYASEKASWISSLRENGQITLSLVICSDEGEIVAHLLFSPVDVAEQDLGVQLLTAFVMKPGLPVATISALVQEGLHTLAELGYPVCLAKGQADFLSALGFYPAQDLELAPHLPLAQGALMRIDFDAPKLALAGIVDFKINCLGQY